MKLHYLLILIAPAFKLRKDTLLCLCPQGNDCGWRLKLFNKQKDNFVNVPFPQKCKAARIIGGLGIS